MCVSGWRPANPSWIECQYFDRILALLPAEKDNSPVLNREEINQALVDIPQDTTRLFDRGDVAFDFTRDALELDGLLVQFTRIRIIIVRSTLDDEFEDGDFFLQPQKLLLVSLDSLEGGIEHTDQLLGFLDCEELWILQCNLLNSSR